MNTDFRVSIGLFRHPKYLRLRRELGDCGACSLFELWGFAAQSRPGGKLSEMGIADIALAAGWSGDPQRFIDALVELRWLDLRRRTYYLHGWHEHQQYVIHSRNRSRVASHAAKARWRAATQNRLENVGEIGCSEHAQSIAESNAPSPSPAPNPKNNTSLADARFAEFWELYRLHKAKVSALKAWRKLNPDATLIATILADLKTRSWPADLEHAPYPASYLNGRRWEDERTATNGAKPAPPAATAEDYERYLEKAE
jgi:hypothetical protein